MLDITQIDRQGLDSLNADQLRGLVGQLLDRTGRDAHEIVWRDAKIDKLTFEVAQLKRLQYGKKSEQLSDEQRALFDEAVDSDIAAIEEQIAALQASLPPRTEDPKQTPKRAALPARLPRVEQHHEPDNTTCACGCAMKRIGEDVSEKLDYTPGVFSVERHGVLVPPNVEVQRLPKAARCNDGLSVTRGVPARSRRHFDVFDLTYRLRNGVSVLAHALQMKSDGFANFGLNLRHRGTRSNASWKVRDVGRVVAFCSFDDDGVAHITSVT